MAASSRLALASEAVRPHLKARLMLSGPSGAGKTWSLLEIARYIVGPKGTILLIDTERDSALTYADSFAFTHLPWDAPFDPRDLATTLLEAGGSYDATIIDSLSHFWTGSGGTLDIADGKFGGWKVARPAQTDLVDAILATTNHVLVGVRSKMDYAQEVGDNGRQKVVRLGLDPVQDGTLVYEMNVAAEMDMEHRLSVSKSRAEAVAVGRTYAPGHAMDFASDYGDWLKGGVQIEVPTPEALMALIAALPAEQQAEVKAKWVERSFPHVSALTPHQIVRVLGIIDQVAADAELAARARDKADEAQRDEERAAQG